YYHLTLLLKVRIFATAITNLDYADWLTKIQQNQKTSMDSLPIGIIRNNSVKSAIISVIPV
ncbi:MAG: hypothetical protein ACHQNE_08805, partial [Candidatus Kapaibacterium sp.]